MTEYRINRKNFFWLYVLSVVTCFTIVVPLACIAYIEIKVRATTYIIDKTSVSKKFKFFIINDMKINEKDITDISLTQGLVQRLFNIGNIHINTAGTTFIEMVLVGVENPKEILNILKK